MKVDNILQKEIPALRNEVTDKKNGAVDNKESSASSTNDRVTISSLINYLNQSMTSERADHERSNKVRELKSIVESGKYTVSGQAVAEKMLSLV